MVFSEIINQVLHSLDKWLLNHACGFMFTTICNLLTGIVIPDFFLIKEGCLVVNENLNFKCVLLTVINRIILDEAWKFETKSSGKRDYLRSWIDVLPYAGKKYLVLFAMCRITKLYLYIDWRLYAGGLY